MASRKFWAREWQQESATTVSYPSRNRPLTSADTCDRCGARAYVRVVLPGALELMFCAHHDRQYASAVAKVAVEIHDETDQLLHHAA